MTKVTSISTLLVGLLAFGSCSPAHKYSYNFDYHRYRPASLPPELHRDFESKAIHTVEPTPSDQSYIATIKQDQLQDNVRGSGAVHKQPRKNPAYTLVGGPHIADNALRGPGKHAKRQEHLDDSP